MHANKYAERGVEHMIGSDVEVGTSTVGYTVAGSHHRSTRQARSAY